jgi:hypothetical protein
MRLTFAHISKTDGDSISKLVMMIYCTGDSEVMGHDASPPTRVRSRLRRSRNSRHSEFDCIAHQVVNDVGSIEPILCRDANLSTICKCMPYVIRSQGSIARRIKGLWGDKMMMNLKGMPPCPLRWVMKTPIANRFLPSRDRT